MDIYYGRFIEAGNILITGKIYYRYFNSEQAVYNYKEKLREQNIYDILEAVGKAEFNKNGVLYEIEETEKILYNPDK